MTKPLPRRDAAIHGRTSRNGWSKDSCRRPSATGCSARTGGTAPRRSSSAGRLPPVGWVAGWVITGVGVAVVLAALRDIFHTLWHPSGRGGLARKVLAAVWRAGRPRRGHHRVRLLAGPLAMVVVVVAWVA